MKAKVSLFKLILRMGESSNTREGCRRGIKGVDLKKGSFLKELKEAKLKNTFSSNEVSSGLVVVEQLLKQLQEGSSSPDGGFLEAEGLQATNLCKNFGAPILPKQSLKIKGDEDKDKPSKDEDGFKPYTNGVGNTRFNLFPDKLISRFDEEVEIRLSDKRDLHNLKSEFRKAYHFLEGENRLFDNSEKAEIKLDEAEEIISSGVEKSFNVEGHPLFKGKEHSREMKGVGVFLNSKLEVKPQEGNVNLDSREGISERNLTLNLGHASDAFEVKKAFSLFNGKEDGAMSNNEENISLKVEKVYPDFEEGAIKDRIEFRGTKSETIEFLSKGSEEDFKLLNNSQGGLSKDGYSSFANGDFKEEMVFVKERSFNLPEGLEGTFTDFLKKFEVSIRDGKREAFIELQPPELGKVKFSIEVQDDKVSARFWLPSPEVKNLFENNIQQLQALFRGQGYLFEASFFCGGEEEKREEFRNELKEPRRNLLKIGEEDEEPLIPLRQAGAMEGLLDILA